MLDIEQELRFFELEIWSSIEVCELLQHLIGVFPLAGVARS